MASIDWINTTTVRQDEKHVCFGIWCDFYWRFDGKLLWAYVLHTAERRWCVKPFPYHYTTHHYMKMVPFRGIIGKIIRDHYYWILQNVPKYVDHFEWFITSISYVTSCSDPEYIRNEFPLQRYRNAELVWFCIVRLNKLLYKPSNCLWYVTNWRSCGVIGMNDKFES